jgi:hypothetical protein
MALKATPPRNTRTKSNDAITGDDVTRLNAEKLQRQKDAKTEPEAPENKDAPEDKEQSSTITKSQFDQLTAAIQTGADAAAKLKVVEQELADAKAALEAKDAAVDEEKEALEADADKKGEELDFVQKLFTQLGHPNPIDSSTRYSSQALVTGSKMDAATALREFESMYKDANRKYWTNETTGEQFEHVDTVKLNRYIRKHREEVRDGMEALAKQNGLLRGKDAPTVRTDIPPAYLTYLSAIMRMTHSAKFIFWQFVDVKLEMGKGMGDTMLIPRVNYANAGATNADWQLTPGTPIMTTSQNVSMSSVSATLQEYGMGKAGTPNEPIAIPEFILANSQIELETIVQRNLGYNFNQYEEVSARNLWFASTKTLYNNAGTPVLTAAGVTATAATAKYRGGAVTYQFLINLYAYMAGQQIPAFSNGCYGLVLHEFALAQLKSSLADRNQYLNAGDMADITNTFNAATMSDQIRVQNYQGTIGNFMIFSSNNISMGVAGTIGAQTETVGGVAQITRTSFAFGSNTIGRGTGMGATIRRQVEDDFGRMNRWLWLAHEGWAQLDVDNAVAGQQTRVFKINTTDLEV